MTNASNREPDITAGKGLKPGSVTRRQVDAAVSDIVDVDLVGKSQSGEFLFRMKMKDGKFVYGRIRSDPSGLDIISVENPNAKGEPRPMARGKIIGKKAAQSKVAHRKAIRRRKKA